MLNNVYAFVQAFLPPELSFPMIFVLLVHDKGATTK